MSQNCTGFWQFHEAFEENYGITTLNNGNNQPVSGQFLLPVKELASYFLIDGALIGKVKNRPSQADIEKLWMICHQRF